MGYTASLSHLLWCLIAFADRSIIRKAARRSCSSLTYCSTSEQFGVDIETGWISSTSLVSEGQEESASRWEVDGCYGHTYVGLEVRSWAPGSLAVPHGRALSPVWSEMAASDVHAGGSQLLWGCSHNYSGSHLGQWLVLWLRNGICGDFSTSSKLSLSILTGDCIMLANNELPEMSRLATELRLSCIAFKLCSRWCFLFIFSRWTINFAFPSSEIKMSFKFLVLKTVFY